MRLTNEQRVELSVVPRTAAGNIAAIDGSVAFTSSDETVAVIQHVTPTKVFVVAVGPGAAQITAKFDADLGEGVREIEVSGVVEVVAAEAEVGEIVFGTPELTPPVVSSGLRAEPAAE